MQFRADAQGLDENPLRGLVPDAQGLHDASTFPHSMEWFNLPLSDVVKGAGLYDWTVLEQQLTMTAAHGNQSVIRFYVDNPRLPSGIPIYLLYAGVKTFSYEDEGNATSARPSVAPDYSDRRLIDCMIRFIHALGEKYDGDPRIAYLTAGLYGFWGEWHVQKHPLPGESAGWEMAQKDKDALLRAYSESFLKTQVVVRTAGVTKDRDLLSHFGFHDDSFLWDTIGMRPLFWTGMQQAGTTESWQQHPTGGEIFPPLQRELWDSWPNVKGQDWATAVHTTHATFMFDSALFARTTSIEARANARGAQRMLGYTFFCLASRIVRNKDGSATVTVRIENRGVAPIYYAWPVEAESLDPARRVVGRGKALWPLPTLMPGNTAEWSVILNSDSDRVTKVVLRIANPMRGGHDVAFANSEMSTVRKGWLTLDFADQRAAASPK